TFSTTAVPGSPVGNYPIVPAVQDPGGKLGNYAVSSTNGTLTVTAPGQAHITSVARLSNNHGYLTGTGDTSVTYTIQATSDLNSWQSIGTATSNSSGVF